VVKLGDEQKAIFKAIQNCDAAPYNYNHCEKLEPLHFHADDYDYIFSLPVLKAKSPTLDALDAAYKQWDAGYQVWISQCHDSGEVIANVGGGVPPQSIDLVRNSKCAEMSDLNAKGKSYGQGQDGLQKMNGAPFVAPNRPAVRLVSLIGDYFVTESSGQLWPKKFSQAQFWWPYYDEAFDLNVLPEQNVHCTLSLSSPLDGCKYDNELIPRLVPWRMNAVGADKSGVKAAGHK
jgi:hypothetical protein